MAHRVTFVCEANICRSPLMAFTFARAGGAPLPGEWTVSSRGTHVGGRRAPMCEVSASLISADVGGGEFVDAQRSAPMGASHLNGQDLILVASLAERAAVAKLNPDLRSRTFTLREAVALGRAPVSESERRTIRQDAIDDRVRLDGYPEILHRRRSFVPLPQPARARLWRAAPPSPLDIPDAHHLGPREHLSTLRSVRESAHELRIQLSEYLATVTQ